MLQDDPIQSYLNLKIDLTRYQIRGLPVYKILLKKYKYIWMKIDYRKPLSLRPGSYGVLFGYKPPSSQKFLLTCILPKYRK